MIDYNHDLVQYINDNYEIDEDNLNNMDLYDIIHEHFDSMVLCNGIQDNIEIIIDQVGSVFKAMKNWKDDFGDYNDDNEDVFYASLAYNSIVNNIDNDEIIEKLKEIKEEKIKNDSF